MRHQHCVAYWRPSFYATMCLLVRLSDEVVARRLRGAVVMQFQSHNSNHD